MRTSNPVISRSTTECAECTGVSRHGDVEQDDYRGQPGLLGRTETNPKTSAKTFDEVCVDAFRESARGRGHPHLVAAYSIRVFLPRRPSVDRTRIDDRGTVGQMRQRRLGDMEETVDVYRESTPPLLVADR